LALPGLKPGEMSTQGVPKSKLLPHGPSDLGLKQRVREIGEEVGSYEKESFQVRRATHEEG